MIYCNLRDLSTSSCCNRRTILKKFQFYKPGINVLLHVGQALSLTVSDNSCRSNCIILMFNFGVWYLGVNIFKLVVCVAKCHSDEFSIKVYKCRLEPQLKNAPGFACFEH